MLSVEHVQKTFDRFVAVKDANLTVNRGEIVAVIGPNGAGKSTLFKLITGHLHPERGRVTFKGSDITTMAPYEICRSGISLSFQIVNVFNRLTVFENVQAAVISRQKRCFSLFGTASRVGGQATRDILASVGLTDKADRISGSLSHGDQKLLEIALALGNEPELLILDEPTAGMSPEETFATIDLVKRMNREMGLTILFCEHDMELVFSTAQKIMVMQLGTTIAQGDPPSVKADRNVQQAYLGGSD
jgi:branched-chain amino acid transport system ATP-binding protein